MQHKEIVRKTNWGTAKYVPGKSLDECYFYASDDKTKEEFAVMASDVVSSAIVQLAGQETTDKKLPVQPEEYLDFFVKASNSLGEFKNQVYAMAMKNQAGVKVTAAEEDQPVWATEPQTPIKAQAEPQVAAEAGLTAQSKEGGRAKSPVKQFFNKLPGDVSDKPEWGQDFQSSAVAQENAALKGQLVTQAEELDMAKKELTDTKKDHELNELKEALTDAGVVKKPQDWEKYSKMFKDLDEKALGVIETLVHDMAKAKGEGDAGEPPKYPAKKPAAPGAGAGDGMPPVQSSGNIIVQQLPSEADYGNSNQALANMWFEHGQKQSGNPVVG